MNPQNPQKIREQIREHRAEAEKLEQLLNSAEASCSHRWGPVTRDDRVTPGYRLEGDPPGTMGIDRQLPCDVSEEREMRWRRDCQRCGKVERTSQFHQEIVKEPKF